VIAGILIAVITVLFGDYNDRVALFEHLRLAPIVFEPPTSTLAGAWIYWAAATVAIIDTMLVKWMPAHAERTNVHWQGLAHSSL
jgi:hypothetical protein